MITENEIQSRRKTYTQNHIRPMSDYKVKHRTFSGLIQITRQEEEVNYHSYTKDSQ